MTNAFVVDAAAAGDILYKRYTILKPRLHQQQCPSNIAERYKLNDSFDNVECCFDIVAAFGNNVAGFGNNVAVFGNNVERCFENIACCFDIVAGVDGALQICSVAVDVKRAVPGTRKLVSELTNHFPLSVCVFFALSYL